VISNKIDQFSGGSAESISNAGIATAVIIVWSVRLSVCHTRRALC